MKLPLSYFDTKKTGDTLQRIEDHSRIQQFLTAGSLSVLFSLINLLTFSIVLLLYNVSVFFVFLAGSIHLAKVILPKGLHTNYGKTLHYQFGLFAQAEIITEKMRLLERFYYNIRKQINRG